MKTISELVDDAIAVTTQVALAKKLATDLAGNIKLAKDVLTERDLSKIEAAYTQAHMHATSRALDEAIAAARKND